MFEKFNLLSTELRHEVWALTLPGPRTISFGRRLKSEARRFSREFDMTGRDPARSPTTAQTRFTSFAPEDMVSTLSKTCMDSRSFIMSRYALLFPASSTWFSFSTDILFVDWRIHHSYRWTYGGFGPFVPSEVGYKFIQFERLYIAYLMDISAP